MRPKTKAYATVATVFLMFSFAMASIAAGAGSITLPSTAQAPGGSVPVSGTGFGATKALGIGFGAEVSASQTSIPFTGTGPGPYSGNLSYRPIKPGSFVIVSDTTAGGGVVTTYTDKGDGTLASDSQYFVSGTIDYATGQWSRTSTIDLTETPQNYSASYIRYQYSVTPTAGANTSSSGTFATSITVPTVANGNYNVTVIDSQGNRATATLTIDVTIPEGLSVGVTVLLSSFAVLAGSAYFLKRPKIPH